MNQLLLLQLIVAICFVIILIRTGRGDVTSAAAAAVGLLVTLLLMFT